VRRRFAERIAKQQKVDDRRPIEAFASVPREDFLGPGPWQVLDNTPHYVATAGDDPALVYVNAPIALDAGRRINNGEPALHIGMMASLSPRPGDHVVHIGVGGAAPMGPATISIPPTAFMSMPAPRDPARSGSTS
jgi:protein-L-isoaspartate(D-aspartate) O-methyltransferase